MSHNDDADSLALMNILYRSLLAHTPIILCLVTLFVSPMTFAQEERPKEAQQDAPKVDSKKQNKELEKQNKEPVKPEYDDADKSAKKAPKNEPGALKKESTGTTTQDNVASQPKTLPKKATTPKRIKFSQRHKVKRTPEIRSYVIPPGREQLARKLIDGLKLPKGLATGPISIKKDQVWIKLYSITKPNKPEHVATIKLHPKHEATANEPTSESFVLRHEQIKASEATARAVNLTIESIQKQDKGGFYKKIVVSARSENSKDAAERERTAVSSGPMQWVWVFLIVGGGIGLALWSRPRGDTDTTS